MNRYKKLGILLSVLVVVCAATLLLSRYEEKQEQIRTSDAIILEIPTDTVTALSWEYDGGGSLAFHKEEGLWRYDEDADFPVSEKKVNDILSHFEAFGVSFLIENVEDYGQYGLDRPECTLHISTEEASYDIRLGDYSKMDEQRYVDIGDGNVYLVREDPMDYVDAALSGMIENDDTPGFETVTDIRFAGAQDYTIQRLEDSGCSYSENDVYFISQNGNYLPLDTSAVTKYLNTITSLDLSGYVTYHATDEELAAFGLDSPELSVTVSYTNTDEDSGEPVSGTCVLHISRNPEEVKAAREAEEKGENAKTVSMYVRVGDSRIVYPLDSVDYGILSAASYNDLRHKEVFWADWEDVTRMEITLEGKTHTMTSEPGKEDGRVWHYPAGETAPEDTEAPSETETEATEPAEESLDLSDFRDALLALRADSFTDETPGAQEELRLTLRLDNENFPETEIVLYRYDGSGCLAQVDGETVSLVPRASVMKLVEAVQAIVLNG